MGRYVIVLGRGCKDVAGSDMLLIAGAQKSSHARITLSYLTLYADFGLSNLCAQSVGKSEWQMSVAKLNDAKVRGKLRKGSGRNFRFDGKTTLEVIAEVMAKAERNVGEMFLSVW